MFIWDQADKAQVLPLFMIHLKRTIQGKITIFEIVIRKLDFKVRQHRDMLAYEPIA